MFVGINAFVKSKLKSGEVLPTSGEQSGRCHRQLEEFYSEVTINNSHIPDAGKYIHGVWATVDLVRITVCSKRNKVGWGESAWTTHSLRSLYSYVCVAYVCSW